MSELSPETPQEKLFYLPDALGLDPAQPDDMNLYINSEGDEIIAKHLLAQRELKNQHFSGYIDDEKYNRQFDQIESLIEERRRAIGSPYSKEYLDHKK